ncbi:right-handed parallel beta-helix repeat-containing protein [Halostagnicola bangensis]
MLPQSEQTRFGRSVGIGIIVVLAVTGLTAAGIGLGSVSGENVDVTEVDSCTTITEPGNYQLSTDIEDASEDICIEIEANNVVLDGGGHTIDGDVTEGEKSEFVTAVEEDEETFPTDPEWQRIGVSVGAEADLSSVAVRNVTVTDWFFGVNYESVTNGEVQGVTAENNGDGISAYNSSQVTFADSTASNGSTGFIFDSWDDGVSEDNTIRNVDSQSNTFDGVAVWETTDLEVTESTISDNDVGLVLGIETDDSTVSNVEVDGNTQIGVLSLESSGQQFQNVAVRNTRGDVETEGWADLEPGAFVFVNTANSTIEDSTALDNEQWVYHSSDESADNTVENLETEAGTFAFSGTDVAVQHVPPEEDEQAPEPEEAGEITATIERATISAITDHLEETPAEAVVPEKE